jgi:sugar O-acyltransferase (sialic acid O-acetyltransferase NeuD family)
MKRIVLFGGGNHVTYCLDIIEKQGLYEVVGITDPYIPIGTEIQGYPVIGKQEDLKELIEKYNIDAGIVTIGDNWIRKIVKEKVVEIVPDFQFVSAIHPSVVLGSNVSIGQGTVMMAGCIVSPNTTIGEFCFFATGAILEHDSIMHDFASLSAGSMTGGKVEIGEGAAITLSVTLFDRIKIGKHSVIGSGSLVTKDIPDNVLAYGVPAKVIRTREPHERFLKA